MGCRPYFFFLFCFRIAVASRFVKKNHVQNSAQLRYRTLTMWSERATVHISILWNTWLPDWTKILFSPHVLVFSCGCLFPPPPTAVMQCPSWKRGAMAQHFPASITPAIISSVRPNPSNRGLPPPCPPFSQLQSTALSITLGQRLPLSGPHRRSYAI